MSIRLLSVTLQRNHPSLCSVLQVKPLGVMKNVSADIEKSQADSGMDDGSASTFCSMETGRLILHVHGLDVHVRDIVGRRSYSYFYDLNDLKKLNVVHINVVKRTKLKYNY